MTTFTKNVGAQIPITQNQRWSYFLKISQIDWNERIISYFKIANSGSLAPCQLVLGQSSNHPLHKTAWKQADGASEATSIMKCWCVTDEDDERTDLCEFSISYLDYFDPFFSPVHILRFVFSHPVQRCAIIVSCTDQFCKRKLDLSHDCTVFISKWA